MTNTAPEGKKKKKLTRRQRLALVGTGTLAGLGGIAVLAAWTGQADVSTNLDSGEFALEVSTDGGQTWDESGQLDLSEFGPLAPGDNIVTDFQLRLSEETTHDGVLSSIDLDTVGLEGVTWSMGVNEWTVTGDEGTVGGSFVNGSFGNIEYADLGDPDMVGPVSLAQGDTLDVRLMLFTDGDLPQGASADATWTFLAELDN